MALQPTFAKSAFSWTQRGSKVFNTYQCIEDSTAECYGRQFDLRDKDEHIRRAHTKATCQYCTVSTVHASETMLYDHIAKEHRCWICGDLAGDLERH